MSAKNEDYVSDVLGHDESAYIILGILGAVLFLLLYLYWCAGQCAKQNIRRLGVIILVGKRKEDSERLRTNAEDPPVTEPPPHSLPKTQQVLSPAVATLKSPT